MASVPGLDGVRVMLAGLVFVNAVAVMLLANPLNQRHGKPVPAMIAFGAVVLAAWLVTA